MAEFNDYIKQIKKAKLNKSTPMRSTSKVTSNIRSNTLQAVDVLIKRFLKNVLKPSKPISINDTKELKDVITVFQQIEETTNEGKKQTPAISADAINFISNQTKEPTNRTGAMNGTNQKIKNLDPKDVKALMNNEEKDLDKHNIQKM